MKFELFHELVKEFEPLPEKRGYSMKLTLDGQAYLSEVAYLLSNELAAWEADIKKKMINQFR